MSKAIGRFCRALTRRKPMDVNDDLPTDLDRCLNTLDLTAMGVGATLGFGLYVLTGEVAADKAGPGVILSFMIAAVASTFSALCYAEFAAKVPKSGSAYAYSYITVGEFIAFIIGWNLMLEHVIGTAALARGYSGYLKTLFSSTQLSTRLNSHSQQLLESSAQLLASNSTAASHAQSSLLPQAMPLTMSAHGAAAASSNGATAQSLFAQFDEIALVLTILVTGLLLLGVQVSSRFQITFASINLSVAVFIFVCGLFKADFHNWNLTVDELPKDRNVGTGGFLPFGFSGVMAGAGTVFFAFVGFDGIAATAEEVRNPRKAIPNSIIWTSIIIFFTYCGIATVQTLIWPYWDQKQSAPLPYIFDKLNMPFAKWTILVGVLAGLSTSFVGGFLPLPRIMYAMARDGVIYRVLARISERFKVPFISTIVGGIIIALMASTLDISQLSDMLSIGTLAAYSLVSISVLLLRYEYRKPKQHFALPIASSATLSKFIDESFDDANGEASLKMQATKPSNNFKLTVGDNLSPNHLLKSAKLDDDSAASKKKLAFSANLKGDPSSNQPGQPGSGSLQASAASTVSSTEQSAQAADEQTPSNQCTPLSNSPTSMGRRASAVARIQRPLHQVFWQGKTSVQRNNDGQIVSSSLRLPDIQSTNISRVLITLLIVVTTIMDFILVKYNELSAQISDTGSSNILNVIICSLFALTVLLGLLLDRLPTTAPSSNSFEVPLVPGIPLFSIIINTYLMINLPGMTWIRFGIWMAIGFFIYFTYGIFNSTGYKDSRCD